MMPNLAQAIADGGAPTVGETSALERAADVVERLIKVVSEAAERAAIADAGAEYPRAD